jgi:small-conductance mechanosensitive channel
MATPPVPPISDHSTRTRIFGQIRLVVLLALVALLGLCLIFSWTTRDAMVHLPFLSGQGKARVLVDSQKTLVDLLPWQTAEALAALAVTSEETKYAQEAERLADHEVDQAFASALRRANLQAQHRTLTGEALDISQKVAQLQQLVKDDQALVQRLTPASSLAAGPTKENAQPATDSDDLEIAQAQLGLDSDQLADAQEDLERASGDTRSQIQSELAAHEAAMKKYEAETHGEHPTAVTSAAQHGTLAARLKAWVNQRDRYRLIQQALQKAQDDTTSLTAEHKALEVEANANLASSGEIAPNQADKLARLKERSTERQLLSISSNRIQTQQQLAAIYSKWSAQVLLQHRILLHLILQSLALIVLILICTILGDSLARRVLSHPAIDGRQMQTLRTVLQMGIQVIGALLILLVVFGSPQQMPTILGLATAGITIVLQDFILAFFGWFVLMGKNGIRVGDWVEINGVGGEVTEIGLMSTMLLETGKLEDRGHPTGRRISFINSFAIRGQFFNFTTTGQWMWDEIAVSLPATVDPNAMAESIHQAVLEETKESAQIAELEWRRGSRNDGLYRFSAAPMVNLLPSGSGIEVHVRYVTRASERVIVRNRLYQNAIDLLQKQVQQTQTEQIHRVENT